jgi:uncharacterized protein DUF1844
MADQEEGGKAPDPMNTRDLFLALVQSFQAAAMQQMGKIVNPFTEKIERDLAQAKLSIDMLEMLKERTAGNLVREEARLLDHILTELRLNYVDEVQRGEGPKAEEGGGKSPGSATSE